MSDFRIASGHVLVTADTSQVTPGVLRALRDMQRPAEAEGRRVGEGIGRQIESGIRRTLRSMPRVRIDLDLAAARDMLTRFKRELRDLSPVRVRVDLDLGSALPQLTTLQRLLDQMDGRTVNVGVNADVGGASARLAAFRAQLDALAARHPTVTINADTDGAVSGAQALLRVIGSLAPAMIPAAAAVGAGVMSIGAAFGVAAAAGGAFALAVKPQFAEMNEAVKEYDKALKKGVEPAKALKDVTSQMSGPAKDMTVSYLGLRGAISDWSDSLAPTTLPIFTQLFDKLRLLVPKMTPVVKDVAGALKEFMDTIGSNHAGAVFKEFGGNVDKLGGSSLLTFLNIVKNLATGFVGMLNAFAPMSVSVTGGLEEMTKKFAKWGATLKENQGFQDFLKYAKENAPLVLGMLKDLFVTVGKVVVALAPLGGVTLAVVAAFADLIAMIPTPVLRVLGTIIGTLLVSMRLYALYVATVSAATRLWAAAQLLFNTVMAANPITIVIIALVALGAALVIAYKKSETFRDIVNGAWKKIKEGLSIAWEYIKKVFGWMKDLFMNFTGPGLLIKHWDTIKTKTKEAFDKVKGWISTAITFIKDLFLNFTGPGLLIKHWETIKTKTSEIWNAVKKKVSDVINGVKDTINTVLGTIKRLWSEAWTAVRDFFTTRWNNIRTNVSAAWTWLKDSVSKLKTSITKTWSDAWNAIRDKLTAIWSAISKKVTDAWAWLRTQFTNVKNAITKTWSDAWTAIRNKLSDMWASISKKVTDSWAWLRARFTDVKNAITKTWSDAWTAIRNKLSEIWSSISKKVTDSFSSLRGKFTDVKNSITKTWSDAWGAVKSKTSEIVGSVLGKVNEFKDKVKTAFNTAKNGISEVWTKVQDVVKKPINYVIDPIYKSGVKGLWDKVAGFVGLGKLPSISKLAAGGTVGAEPGMFSSPTAIVGEGNPNYPEYVIPTDPKYRKRALGLYESAGTQLMADGGILGSIWDNTGGKVVSGVSNAASSVGGWIKDKAGDLAAGALEPFFKAGMKVVDGMVKHIPGLTTGMGKIIGAMPRTIGNGVISWLKGKDSESSGGGDVSAALKWAKTQAGKPYQWGGAGNPSWDCSGFMSGIQKKIQGKDPKGRLWSTFSFNGSQAPAGWVRNLKSPFMIGITNKGKGHTAGTLGGTNVESRGGDGVIVGPKARGYNNSLFGTRYGFKPAINAGGDWSAKGTGVSRWRPNVIQELKHLGLSTGWQDTVLRRMNQESGGDPNVVNKWDSNWKAGYPSVGLMQVIRGTFAAYAGSHRNTGPKKYGVSVNPNANIHAGLNYANKRYGSLSALNRPGGYDDGGLLQPGATLAFNKTNKPERVLTDDQWEKVTGSKSVDITIHLSTLTGTLTRSQEKELGKQLRDLVRDGERTYK